MPTPITVTIPHQLGRVAARQRIEAGFANLIRQMPGVGGACSQRWDGDQLSFSVAAVGQTIAGVVDVHDADVTMAIELPGWLGVIAGAIEGRLHKAAQLLLTRK